MFDANQLVLTTDELAQAFGTTRKVLTNNFQRHKEDFIKEIHYYLLEGEELKQFLSIKFADLPQRTTNVADLPEMPTNIVEDSESLANFADLPERFTDFADLSQRNANKIRNLYLWTVKGAFEHAWLLKSPQAKQACEKLMDQAMQGAPVAGLLEENANLRQQVQMHQAIAEKALSVERVKGMPSLIETEEISMVITRVRQLNNKVEAALEAGKFTDILDIMREREREVTKLEARMEKVNEVNVAIGFKFSGQKETLKQFHEQAQALLPPARQEQLPPAQQKQIAGPQQGE